VTCGPRSTRTGSRSRPGRRSWRGTAAATPKGATYSLVESCKAAGVEPNAYFADVLARTTTATPRELTPRAWKAARELAVQAGIPS